MSAPLFEIQQSRRGYYITFNGLPIHEITMNDSSDSECFEAACLFRDFAEDVADALLDRKSTRDNQPPSTG